MGVNVARIKLGSQGLEMSKQGLGCLGMSDLYGLPKPEPEMIELIHHTFLDTSDAYGPHTNGILIGKRFPRFKEENLETNKVVYEKISEMATRKGFTPSQLALAWVHHQGEDVCPIPRIMRTSE